MFMYNEVISVLFLNLGVCSRSDLIHDENLLPGYVLLGGGKIMVIVLLDEHYCYD